MKKQKRKFQGVTFYTTKNEGDFPEDMLRYDRAFVHPKFPQVVAFAKTRSLYGVDPGLPTDARWRSFGYVLTPVTDNLWHHFLAEHFRRGAWTTVTNELIEIGYLQVEARQFISFDGFLR